MCRICGKEVRDVSVVCEMEEPLLAHTKKTDERRCREIMKIRGLGPDDR